MHYRFFGQSIYLYRSGPLIAVMMDRHSIKNTISILSVSCYCCVDSYSVIAAAFIETDRISWRIKLAINVSGETANIEKGDYI